MSVPSWHRLLSVSSLHRLLSVCSLHRLLSVLVRGGLCATSLHKWLVHLLLLSRHLHIATCGLLVFLTCLVSAPATIYTQQHRYEATDDHSSQFSFCSVKYCPLHSVSIIPIRILNSGTPLTVQLATPVPSLGKKVMTEIFFALLSDIRERIALKRAAHLQAKEFLNTVGESEC